MSSARDLLVQLRFSAHASFIKQFNCSVKWWLFVDRVCAKCYRVIHDNAAIFCPYCSANLTPMPPSLVPVKRSGFPTTAGILTILAACIAVLTGMLGIVVYASDIGYYTYPYGTIYQWFFMGVFGIHRAPF